MEYVQHIKQLLYVQLHKQQNQLKNVHGKELHVDNYNVKI